MDGPPLLVARWMSDLPVLKQPCNCGSNLVNSVTPTRHLFLFSHPHLDTSQDHPPRNLFFLGASELPTDPPTSGWKKRIYIYILLYTTASEVCLYELLPFKELILPQRMKQATPPRLRLQSPSTWESPLQQKQKKDDAVRPGSSQSLTPYLCLSLSLSVHELVYCIQDSKQNHQIQECQIMAPNKTNKNTRLDPNSWSHN